MLSIYIADHQSIKSVSVLASREDRYKQRDPNIMDVLNLDNVMVAVDQAFSRGGPVEKGQQE